MIPAVQSTPYSSGLLPRVNRAGMIAPPEGGPLDPTQSAGAALRTKGWAKADAGSFVRPTQHMVTIDEQGRLLFQVIDDITQEVRQQYPNEVFLKIRDYVAGLDRADPKTARTSLSIIL
jgi:hypothetical protein